MLQIDFSSIFGKIRGKSVGIQLPDGLKYYAKDIAEIFERKGFEVILSGKPSYGACDVDLDLLKHVDVLLHFGHTKLLDYDRVLYIPYEIDYEVDPELLKKEIHERRIAIIGTANYAWKFKEIKKILEESGFKVMLKRGIRAEYEGQVLGCDYSSLEGLNVEAVLFIGDGRFHAIGASIYTKKKVYAYNPLMGEIEIIKQEDFLKRRYFAVSKAKLCESFGILVSTKPGQKRLGLAQKLRNLAKERGKKAEIILTDEITPQLTENFRFDCYVNTACPRIVYDDYKRFEKPLITPPEFEVVLGLKSEIEMDTIFR
uniref:2-(3-amino-3-carboxypropyl)histidine synthase n=1 Tax=Geoglobus ahangari TaxID=113653 RepID=A0A7C3YFY9_9EURY